MAYTIKYQGYDVTCDTVAEVRALLSENGNKPQSIPTQDNAILSDGASKMDVLVSKLQKEQRDLLKHVVSHGMLTRDKLRQMVGITDPHKFAGVLISISKSAAGSGIKTPVESMFERENGSGPRVYQYKIRNAVKAELKEALAKVQ